MNAARYFAQLALLPNGWARNVRIDVDPRGTIVEILRDSTSNDAIALSGAVVPGMPNAHSHAFQRALAGRLERASPGREDFWTWREGMYELVERLGPDDVESVATYLYVEMLEAGYTSVAEFHYLHNDPRGVPYESRTEIAQRLLAASRSAGIGMTLLPVLYRRAGFDREDVMPAQRRFVTSVDELVGMFDEMTDLTRDDSRVRIGIAAHSLRAVGERELRALVDAAAKNDTTPIHIHIAEQQREVDECVRHYGSRPIEWLLNNVPVSHAWTLVHATHVTLGELEKIARSNATVAVCPTTEANLGDGIFPADGFLRAGGKIAIGSDGHVAVDPAEELRLLEYGQRLTQQRRVVLARNDLGSVGQTLYVLAGAGGAESLGVRVGAIEIGHRADLITLDLEDPMLAVSAPEGLLDAWLLRGRALVKDVIVAGTHVVREGGHAARETAARGFKQTLARLFG